MKMRFLLLLALLLATPVAAWIDQREENVDDPAPSQRNEPAVSDIGSVAQQSPGLRPGSFRFSTGDGHFIHRQRVSGGRAYLRCVLSQSPLPCPVRAMMNADGSNFVVSAGNYGPDPLHDRVQQLRKSLLDACRARPNVRVDILYHEVSRNVHREVLNRVSLLSVRPSMVRAQAEHRPRIPHSFEELHETLEASLELRQTLDGEELLYRRFSGAVGHRSLVFMSDRVMQGIGPVSQSVMYLVTQRSIPDLTVLFPHSCTLW